MRGLIKNWGSISQINLDNYDMLLFNEIWKINDYENLNLPEFKLVQVNQRVNSRGGGTAIFLRHDIKYEIIQSPFIEGVIETTACKIEKTIFCNIYRPPQGSKETCIDTLMNWIESNRCDNIFLAGDKH